MSSAQPAPALAEAERPVASAAPGLSAKVLPFPGAPEGRFVVHEKLGRGATATVFRGTDLADGRPVALKIAEGPNPLCTT